MKKLTTLFFLIAPALLVKAQTTRDLKASLTITMPRTADDDMPGTRGAAVVWHPVQKKYYAAMAGNIGYPLGVYDATGKLLSDETLNTEQDIRGLWYNAARKQIQGNTYNDYGWFYYTLNAKGIPLSSTTFVEGMAQPTEQSTGAFNSAKQQVLFLSEGNIYTYDMTGKQLENTLRIHWGRTQKEGISEDETEEAETPEGYNSSMVYTGIKGAELGFLNITDMQIELYNMNNGFLTQKLKLPEDAPMNTSFNFSYSNGMYWLFSIEERTWKSYK